LAAELRPEEKYPRPDVLWRQTERERVYNFLIYVPIQLEGVMWFGFALCLWTQMAALTVAPFRAGLAVGRRVWGGVARLGRGRRGASADGGSNGGGSLDRPGRDLYDVVCLGLLAGSVLALHLLRPGAIYYCESHIPSDVCAAFAFSARRQQRPPALKTTHTPPNQKTTPKTPQKTQQG
jgi:hypothetical protein